MRYPVNECVVLRLALFIHRSRTHAEQRPVFDARLVEKALQRSRGGEHLGGQVVRVKWHRNHNAVQTILMMPATTAINTSEASNEMKEIARINCQSFIIR